MKVITLVVLVMLVFTLLAAPDSESNEQENAAYSSLAQGIRAFKSAYDNWNAGEFKESDALIKSSIDGGFENYLPYYWRGVVNFHLVNYYLWGTKESFDKDQGMLHLKVAIEALEKALTMNERDAESLALTGTLYGMKIHDKPYLSPFLGPKVSKLIKKGLEIEPENPRVHYLIGVSYFFSPKILGGGADKALTYFLKARTFFVKEAAIPPLPLEPRWGHSTCVGFIGKTYMKLNNSKEAESYFKEALSINPQDKLAKWGLAELAELKR